MNLSQIQEKMFEMQDLFFEFEDSIEDFVRDPKVSNRRIVLEKCKFFNYKKNKLISEIKDFWCKGE